MPYEIAEVGGKWVVRKKTNHKKVFGTHPTREKALAQLRAIEVNTHEHGSVSSGAPPPIIPQAFPRITAASLKTQSLKYPVTPTVDLGRRVEVRRGN